jgi:predicted dehydrogenase
LVVVGTGYFSQFHCDVWERLGVKIVGICSLDENEAKKYSHAFDNCKVYLNFEEMIVKALPDILDIVIPPQNHLKFIKIAAKNSVNVICQKPFTNSLAEAKKAIKTAKNHGIKIAVHENFRYQPWYRKIDDLLKSFLLGDIFQVSFRMRPGDGQGKEAYLNRQPYFQEMERFLIHETAIHFIDVYRFLFGDIKSVFATLSNLNKNITGEDAGMVFIDFKSGVKGLFDGNRLSDHIAKDRRLTIGEMLIEGSKGTIRLNGDGEIFFRKFNKNNEKLIKYKWSSKGFAGDSVFYYQKHVIDHFIKGEHLINNAEDYIVNIKIEESIYKSNKYKKLIDIK